MIYFLMAVCAAGMVFGAIKSRNGHGWARFLAVACALVALLLALSSILSAPAREKTGMQIMKELERYRILAGEKVGSFISDEYPAAHILVIGMSEAPSLYLKGLERGVSKGASLELVVPQFASARQEIEGGRVFAENEYTAMDENVDILNAALIDAAIAGAKQCPDIIVSLAGLPPDYENMDLWRQAGHPPLILLGGASNPAGLPGLARKIADGDIAGMVLMRPDYDFQKAGTRLPRDMEDAFAERYILVTPKNIESTASRFPQLFQ